ncbi:MAG: acetyl-CoA carboxylase biotin carboxyl carrier protein subunit [Nitrosarchaeum sp.]|jgi:biotin carboxyl carrier protein|nr:acetyl-CoA carboxylase biotin carboxyl carrier protein subunit [Nitrosarchaeum sp.]MBP0119894.1 acetyl-CoA carboxylase biotin carboxyl carrier protein subunit [Nitrosarchaeum sp.]MBP0134604.1 acetyl-CoA carboxylase biotin carboxyl carrier protein subunit [Nitrosarchaeum sp.]MSV26031.1 acetyl-CoA carboxylase biotin carboxyl carrier protein subunit [Nitrosarchaeum sp.]PHY09566.1 MAG: acetyl-CoA carboxylase biotin carboxyl carrier protein subunit [Nitrosarchaeum sp.]
MDYKIKDIEKIFVGDIIENLGNNEYVIKINADKHQIKILKMDSKGIEFILDQKYHRAKYLENLTNEMNLIVDNVPITINMHPDLDKIVFKNSGGAKSFDTQITLKSQIPGKVVSITVQEGDSVNQGDVICTLESMKMQVAVKSHKSGSIKSIKIKVGGNVAKNDVIAEIE